MGDKPRDRLITSALKLFSRYGFHSTGIDTILAESKVAKTTLYKHFKSKNALVVAVLSKHDKDFREWLVKIVDDSPVQPSEKLLVIFDAYKLWAKRDDFNGCAFVKAASEFPSADSPIHIVCAKHKELMTNYIQELADSANIPESDRLAIKLMMLLEGATVLTQIAKEADVFNLAKESAQELIG
ncbi:TetR/AcrR family transcriptional regulator [Nodosilinea sp. E11]|uniref:TetR/AcrR family transcriptional regulator n=1 Tax=Nodosilinea sp. E11 TaxID=3037479 RepID=UPI00293489E2|nr:TetR/AcrR family transcriptional regulator [Nodosilinea sp. E11]WOD37243.1 TetR/AcrR family transcriptional regulator [Nodosilinea sp. E11]